VKTSATLAKRLVSGLGLVVLLMACKETPPPQAPPPASPAPERPPTLSEVRASLATRIGDKQRRVPKPTVPPAAVFELVRYPSKVGPLAAYVTPRPMGNNKRRPAIVWLIGGFSNSISESLWQPAPADNDQSARAFRDAGIVLMLPSFRGGNDNPGRREGFLGEVDDVIAAADYLSKLDYVDPERIYLGGHSTGGTLALLAAETTDRFRAVFAFGPVADIRDYGASFPYRLPDDMNEVRARSPMYFTWSIRTPTFVFEGVDKPSNSAVLPDLLESARSAPVKTFAVKGADHFSILAPVTELIALKVLSDVGPEPRFAFSTEELEAKVREVAGRAR
jgi:acetyl esterase/lipase